MYGYFSLEFYDQENGIRGGGGLGVLAADTRRIMAEMGKPMVVVTPFYPVETRQVFKDGVLTDETLPVDYHDFGFEAVDFVNVKCNGELCRVEILRKKLGSTEIVAVTEPNFGALYAGFSGSDHRLYQEVCLGFGGYAGLRMLGIQPKVFHLNEVPTVFAAVAELDALVASGRDFYEVMTRLRQRTLYTNHTLVQAAEAEFSADQFERYVMPNIKTPAVRRWVKSFFWNGRVKLSTLMLEIAGKSNGVSKLHARLADYQNADGEKVNFLAVTNGIDLKKWVLPEILEFYHDSGILDQQNLPTAEYKEALGNLTAGKIRELKATGRAVLNQELLNRPDQNGQIVEFAPEDFIFTFKRRLVDYKRPELTFEDLDKLRAVLEPVGAHYVIAGRVHTGDVRMFGKLNQILEKVQSDEYLRDHVHYFADYDEKLAYALSVGSNVAVNTPIVGLEACGTSWMKDVANWNLLISTPDGGVADVKNDNYLCIEGENEAEALYARMAEAAAAWQNDFELEFWTLKQLSAFLPIIAGARMVKEYLAILKIV